MLYCEIACAMNRDGVCAAPRVFFCPSSDGDAMHKFQFAQWMQNVAFWKLSNDINKAPRGSISSFAVLTSRAWVDGNINPVPIRIQTITKESPQAPVDFATQIYLMVIGVRQTGDIRADIYAGPEYEALVSDLKKKAQLAGEKKDVSL